MSDRYDWEKDDKFIREQIEGEWEKEQQEKPLHVRVAEALGWSDIEPCGAPDHCGRDPEGRWRQGHQRVPHYDTSWEDTGPLIEKYGITLAAPLVDEEWRVWNGHGWEPQCARADGPTPLIAVCNLILALHAAGKLPK